MSSADSLIDQWLQSKWRARPWACWRYKWPQTNEGAEEQQRHSRRLISLATPPLYNHMLMYSIAYRRIWDKASPLCTPEALSSVTGRNISSSRKRKNIKISLFRTSCSYRARWWLDKCEQRAQWLKWGIMKWTSNMLRDKILSAILKSSQSNALSKNQWSSNLEP